MACKTKANALWREVDPNNATPWMVELDLTPDNSTRALGAIAQSSRYSVYPSSVAGAALAAMPRDLPPYLQQRLLLDVMRMEDQQTQRHGTKSPGGPFYGLCITPTDSAGQAVGSQATPQAAECLAIAQLFAERSDTLDGHVLGLRTGVAAGWPMAETSKRFEQAMLLQRAGKVLQGAQPYGCAAVDKLRDLLRDTAGQGEMVALRALAAEKINLTPQPTQP